MTAEEEGLKVAAEETPLVVVAVATAGETSGLVKEVAECFLEGGALSKIVEGLIDADAAEDEGTEEGVLANREDEFLFLSTRELVASVSGDAALPPALPRAGAEPLATAAFFASFSRSQFSKAKLKEWETESVIA